MKGRLSALVLPLIHLLVLGAGFVAPYDPAAQNRALAYVPPMRVLSACAYGSGWCGPNRALC